MHRALHLHGEMPAPSERPIPLASKGFRPFFFVAAAFAVAAVPLWLLAFLGVFRPSAYLDPTYWHAHEMLFGYAMAVIAGFLLTAVGNWTGRETLVGPPLLALSALWLAGRIVITCAEFFPRWLPAATDLAFVPVLVVVLARPLAAARNKRNFVMLAILAALFVANLTTHLDVLGVLPGWRRRGCLVAVDIVVLMILIISGRVFPMFTRNATGVASIRSVPILDALTVGAMALLVILDAAAPDVASTAIFAGVVGALAAARSVRWGARHSLRVPLSWILHVGYLWIPAGLGLRALSAVTASVPASTATHALTVGAIGALTLGMMSRVALGHTGRLLTVSRPVVAAFALVTLAAAVRVLGPIVAPAQYRAAVFLAGTLWSGAFAAFLFVYAPILASRRVDGKPG
jgi:uncharacterized protein involved in response to NO